MKNKTDINLIFESYIKNKALTEDNDQYAPEDAPEDDQFGEIEPEEDAESGGVVYVVESDAEYEDTQVHGIFTDFETAKKYAAEVELLPGFWVGIMEMPLNKPEAKGKYHRLS